MKVRMAKKMVRGNMLAPVVTSGTLTRGMMCLISRRGRAYASAYFTRVSARVPKGLW